MRPAPSQPMRPTPAYVQGAGRILVSVSRPTKSPPFAKGGLGGFYTYTYIYTCTYTSPRQTQTAAAPTVIPAQAGIQSPGSGWGWQTGLAAADEVGRRSPFLPHPTLSRWERAFWGSRRL